MADIRAILFDKDGTLIDFDKSWEPINRTIAMAAARGQGELAERFLRLGGMDPVTGKTAPDTLFASGNAQEIAACWIAQGADHDLAELTTLIDEEAARAARFAVPVTDLRALFAQLTQAGLALGVASSDSEAGVRAPITHLGLEEHVSFIAGYDSGHGPKPEPGMIHAFAEAIGCEPSEIAMVGDNIHDMEMAARAGAGKAVGVMSGTGTRETLRAHAHVVVASVADLPQLFAAKPTLL